MDAKELKELKLLSAKIRLDVLKMIAHVGQGHVGGSLSIVEVLSVLYGKCMHYDVTNPNDVNRDRLVLSKGHAGPGLYSTLANIGFFDKEMLYTLNQGGTNLPSHPDRNKTPGVDMTTGSLGQGISVAAGIAKGIKLKESDAYVYVIVGDGELNEGQCWEAFQFISHYQLDNCIVFIDDNKKQLDGTTTEVLNPFNLVNKMEAFGFCVQKVKGNNEQEIYNAIKTSKGIKNRAHCIILDTIKGQGVSYFEEMVANHSVKFTEEVIKENEKAIVALERYIEEGLS